MQTRRNFLTLLATTGGAMLLGDVSALARSLTDESSRRSGDAIAKGASTAPAQASATGAAKTGVASTAAVVAANAAAIGSFKGQDVLNRILTRAKKEQWKKLDTGALMGKVALELVGKPYVAGTLDLDSMHERCTVDLNGLDCVTFFESTLAIARMIKQGGVSPGDLLRQVTFTRYRGGKLGDYTSRLHYTSDWFYDNEQKGVIKILSDLPGAEPFTQKVAFMSSSPKSYKALLAHPELVSRIKEQESAINSRHLTYVPLDKIASIEPRLKTGDIVGVCTSMPGIDIVHTGLVWRDDKGVAHFMDASSKKSKMKVVIEPGAISQALRWSGTLTGAMFARPL